MIYIDLFDCRVEMVREIRDAAEVREKVLLSKLEILIDNCLNSKNMVCKFLAILLNLKYD